MHTTEQAAGSGEGVKKIKKRHPPSEFVNLERKDDDRDAGDDGSGILQVIARYLRGVTRRIGGVLFTQLKMWLGLFRPRPRCNCASRPSVRRLLHSIKVWDNQPPWTSGMRRAEDDDEASLYVHRRDYRHETAWKSARARIGSY